MENNFYSMIEEIIKPGKIISFKEKYFVDDLYGKNLKIIFLLESPHSDEIICKLPAAGNTGIAIAKELSCFLNTDLSIPMGKYIKKNVDHTIFGLVNCCQIPMQSAPYCYDDSLSEMLFHFNIIRHTNVNVMKRKNEITQNWDEAILNDLVIRINKLSGIENKIIIPCGNMANFFLKKCNVAVETINGIPHPAYNNWSKKKSREEITRMKKRIKEVRNGKNN